MKNNKLGLVGGGQLAMLIALVAKKYNIKIMCLELNLKSPASIYSKIINGNYSDQSKLNQLFEENDFVSYEFENINLDALNNSITKFPNKCLQNIYPLFLTNNRIREKINLRNLEIPTNNFSILKSDNDIYYFLKLYKKIIIKTSMFGYDGKGQVLIQGINDTYNINKAKELIKSTECIVEEFVNFKFEVSLSGVYYGDNKFKFLPLNINEHKNGILHTAARFNNRSIQKKAENIFKKLAIGIGYKSIYTIEFFVTHNNELYVNEIAPRVHNSSHHGIDNYNISQYDLFLSLFFELNLPKLKIQNNKILINVLGQHYEKIKKEAQKNKKVIFYDYYKNEIKQNRKMAHILIDIKDTELVNKYKEWCN